MKPEDQEPNANHYNRKESIGYLLGTAFYALRNALHRRLATAEMDVTLDMWIVLNALWERDGQTQHELGLECNKDKSSITKILDNLVKRALIQRQPDAHDRRTKRVCLTEAGLALRAQLFPHMIANLEEAVQGIDAQELAIFKTVLRRIFHNIKEKDKPEQ